MKCPACKTYVTRIPVNWKCPHCGEKLPEPTRLYLLYLDLMETLEGKGAIFWSIWFGVLLLFVGLVELPFGHAYLLGYLGNSILMALVGIFYGGMVIDMVAKVNLPLRLHQGTDFIIKERKVIRNIRKATNLSALTGLVICLVWAGPLTFLEYFPSYPLVISWFLAAAWSVMGLFLDVRMVEDVRFRAYMDRLGITSLKRYRRFGTLCFGALLVVAITFNVLVATSGLWYRFARLAVVGSVVSFAKQYFSWLF